MRSTTSPWIRFSPVTEHIARLDDAAIPGWLRDIVLAVQAQGGEVLRTATALVFYAPARTARLSWPSEPPIAAARNLARRALLRRLERDLGFTFATTPHGSVISPDVARAGPASRSTRADRAHSAPEGLPEKR